MLATLQVFFSKRQRNNIGQMFFLSPLMKFAGMKPGECRCVAFYNCDRGAQYLKSLHFKLLSRHSVVESSSSLTSYSCYLY